MEFIYKLRDRDKDFLRQEHGKIVRDLEKYLQGKQYKKLIAVGDYCSLELERLGFQMDLAIIDGKIERRKINGEVKAEKTLEVLNPAHTITKEAWEKVKNGLSCSRTTKLKIKGEEDLLVLPCIIFAPNNSLVIYGLRGEGSVVVRVNQAIRNKIINFLNTVNTAVRPP